MANTLRDQENAKRSEMGQAQARLSSMQQLRGQVAELLSSGFPGANEIALYKAGKLGITGYSSGSALLAALPGLIAAQEGLVNSLRDQVNALKAQADAYDIRLQQLQAQGLTEEEAVALERKEANRKRLVRWALIITIAIVLIAAGWWATKAIVKRIAAT